jgi:hypothetical protein
MAANKNYPAIRFVVKHGHKLAIIVAIVIVLFGVWGGGRFNTWGWIPRGMVILGGGLAYLMLRAFQELVDVVSDTLLPPE